MTRFLRRFGAALVVGVALTMVSGVSPANASTTTTHVRLRAAVRALHVAKHSHTGSYDRAKDFGDWIYQGDGCYTRAVVLKAESSKPTTQNSNCTIETGRWFSYYNATTYTTASSLQIDHTVPVENVWISGAWRWTQATRVAYYNDLGDGRTLVAVDSYDNESKGDQDPTTWIPSRGHCRYVRFWTAVKTRWKLDVTAAEKTRLARLAALCPNTRLTVTRAAVHYRQ